MRMYAGLVLVGAAISFTAFSAYALEPKQCLPMAEMNAALKAEGQRTLIIGNRAAGRNSSASVSGVKIKKWVNTFTSNADGTLGYNLEGDKPAGQPSETVCVRGKFINVKLYDARKHGTPEAARRGGEFDTYLSDNETKGTRPMLQADAIATAPDGTVTLGNGITLMGNTKVKGGYLIVNYSDGEAAEILVMMNTEYTPTALARLDAQK